MKSLSPANPRVLFVVGIPGAGKTYFAEQFAETFGAPFIEYDAIRAQLTQHPSYSREEDATVARLARHQLGELLKTNHPIIFEGGCESRTDRTALIRFVQEFGSKPSRLPLCAGPCWGYGAIATGLSQKNALIAWCAALHHQATPNTPLYLAASTPIPRNHGQSYATWPRLGTTTCLPVATRQLYGQQSTFPAVILVGLRSLSSDE